MGKEQDYRLTAAEMVDRAHKATTAIDKRRLLGLAEKWLDLAERSERAAAQPQAAVRRSSVGQKDARKQLGRGGVGLAEWPSLRCAARPAG